MRLKADNPAFTEPLDDSAHPDSAKRAVSSQTKQVKDGAFVFRAGTEAGVWEQWHMSVGREPEFLTGGVTPSSQGRRVVTLPSKTLFAWPLWVASSGDSADLVRLELSGRHLLKRGMEASLVVLPILTLEERQLVLAVTVEEPFPEEGMPDKWRSADTFELPARLLADSEGTDLILWQEWDNLQSALYRGGQPVWFCGIREEGLSDTLRRITLRLLAEGILEHPPLLIRVEGVSEECAGRYISELGRAFPEATICTPSNLSSKRLPPPALRRDFFDLPPSEARSERNRLKKQARLLLFATAGILLYLILLLWGAEDLFVRQSALKHLRHEIALIEKPSLLAKGDSERWQALRSAIDPTRFALDLLAAVAEPTRGGKVRLTRFSLESGRLQLSGEATDVTQAYGFIEQLKKNPLLQQYDWNAGQPQLAGKNSVRFDMEGIQPDAKPGS